MRWKGENNGSVYEKCSMGKRVIGVDCEMIERLKLRWFGHMERVGAGEYTKKVYSMGVTLRNFV